MGLKSGSSGKKGSLRNQIMDAKRRKIASDKVVSLAEFRDLSRVAEPSTILVVDDDEIIRNALKRILEKSGYSVLLAEDGMALSKILEKTKLDMILLDVNLPWVDGYELCRIIKGNNLLGPVPLIFISGRKTEEDIQKGFAAGASHYITKPFEIDHLLDVITSSLAKIPPKLTK
ncbi:MAG: response regulator [Oligoflexales bacterium]